MRVEHENTNADRAVFFTDFDSCSGSLRPSLKQVRQEWGWSLMDLAREIEHIRHKKNLPVSSIESIRRHIIDCEKKNHAGPLWRELFAEALRRSPEELFGVAMYREIPFFDIGSTPIGQEYIDIYHAKLDTLVSFEHMFGATCVKNVVHNDVLFLKKYFLTIPRALQNEFALLLARASELAGWVAQELGDFQQADRLTSVAYDYLRYSPVECHAKVLMRRSNILLNYDPYLAQNLITDAEHIIAGMEDSPRLNAAIYKQKALVHFRLHEMKEFHASVAQAQEYIVSDGVYSRPASHVTSAYIASEVAECYISVQKFEKAAAMLLEYKDTWYPRQQRDHAIFMLRLLLSVINMRDYRIAMEIYPQCVQLYKTAPSFRGKMLLRKIMLVLSSQRSAAAMKYVKVLHDALKIIPLT